jgi:hypothetical protein
MDKFKELVEEVSKIDREAGIHLKTIIPDLASFVPSRCLCCAFDWDSADWPYETWHKLYHMLEHQDHDDHNSNYIKNKRCGK